MFQGNTPAGPVDVREIKDVSEGLWLEITSDSLKDLETVGEPRPGYRLYKVNAGNYALVFRFNERLWAAASRRAPVATKMLRALDWPSVKPFQIESLGILK